MRAPGSAPHAGVGVFLLRLLRKAGTIKAEGRAESGLRKPVGRRLLSVTSPKLCDTVADRSPRIGNKE